MLQDPATEEYQFARLVHQLQIQLTKNAASSSSTQITREILTTKMFPLLNKDETKLTEFVMLRLHPLLQLSEIFLTSFQNEGREKTILLHLLSSEKISETEFSSLLKYLQEAFSLYAKVASKYKFHEPTSKKEDVEARDKFVARASKLAEIFSMPIQQQSGDAAQLSDAEITTAASKLLKKVCLDPAVQLKLKRFLKKQETALETATAELKQGKKTSHWIWYIFPQFLDPGRSSLNNSEYQIHGQIEAVAYLLHTKLGQRQRDLFRLVRHQLSVKQIPVCALFSTQVDAKKLHHSASTFLQAAQSLLKENENRGGLLSKYCKLKSADNIWQAVVDVAQDVPVVISEIQKHPYTSILPAVSVDGKCPEHDPIMVATWNKTESWKGE
jgi:uncharacterized protein (DUF1810 family)